VPGQLPDKFQVSPLGLLSIDDFYQHERFGNEFIVLHEMPILRFFVVHDSQFQHSVLQFIWKTLFDSFVRVLFDLYACTAARIGVEIVGYDFVRNRIG
jgi:hypothetical protein